MSPLSRIRTPLAILLSCAWLAGAQAYELKDPQWAQWMSQGHKDELGKAVAQRLAQSPLDGEAWYAKSVLALQKGDDSALDDFADSIEACVKAKPVVALCHLALGQVYGAQATKGTFAAMRVAGKLRDHLKTATEAAPALFDAQQFLLRFYQMAPGVMGGGEDKVTQHLQLVKAQQPDLAPLLQASMLLDKQKTAEAEAVLKGHAGKIRPEWAEGHRQLLTVMANQAVGAKRWGTLQFCADQLKAVHPDWAYGAYVQGRLKAEQSQAWDDALQAYEQARGLKGAERVPLDLRSAQALVGKGQKDQAKGLLAKVLASPTASKSAKEEARKLQATL